MSLKDEIWREICSKDNGDSFLDIGLKSASGIDVVELRRILFELEEEKRIVIKRVNQNNNDARFPLYITRCSQK